MKKIIATIQPFVLKQTVMIYNESDQMELMQQVPMPDVEALIFQLCKEKNINQVKIRGEQHFTKRIKDKLLGLSKYAKMDLNIDLC